MFILLQLRNVCQSLLCLNESQYFACSATSGNLDAERATILLAAEGRLIKPNAVIALCLSSAESKGSFALRAKSFTASAGCKRHANEAICLFHSEGGLSFENNFFISLYISVS